MIPTEKLPNLNTDFLSNKIPIIYIMLNRNIQHSTPTTISIFTLLQNYNQTVYLSSQYSIVYCKYFLILQLLYQTKINYCETQLHYSLSIIFCYQYRYSSRFIGQIKWRHNRYIRHRNQKKDSGLS